MGTHAERNAERDAQKNAKSPVRSWIYGPANMSFKLTEKAAKNWCASRFPDMRGLSGCPKCHTGTGDKRWLLIGWKSSPCFSGSRGLQSGNEEQLAHISQNQLAPEELSR